jgi:hypothetical protein
MNSLALIVMFYNLAKQYAKSYADKLLGRVATGFNWLGAVKYYDDLPTSANEGEAYTVMYAGTEGYEVDGTEYAWGQLDGAYQWIPVRTKGDTGSQGPKGDTGEPGKDGTDGQPGRDGTDGQPGADGYSPTATVEKSGNKAVITVTDKNGTTTAEVYDGKNGDGGSGAIDIIKVNGEAQDIDPSDKSVDITVPSVEGLASENFVTEGFVAKEEGKGLSSNDFSNADKEKLGGLENYDDTTLSERVSNTEDAIDTLNGTGEGSVAKTVSDEIAKVVANAPEDLDTLKEISDWISGHAEDASAMNTAIQKNAGDISDLQKEVAKKANSSDVTTELNKKADKVAGATQGDVAVLDADGNLKDSGVKPLSVSVEDMTICFTEN